MIVYYCDACEGQVRDGNTGLSYVLGRYLCDRCENSVRDFVLSMDAPKAKEGTLARLWKFLRSIFNS